MKNFAKIVVFIFISASLLMSCQKDGQYLPKKKITKIEHVTSSTIFGVTTTAVTSYQEWEWSGKLLTKITLRSGDGDVNGFIVPQYDSKKRLTSLHCVSGSDIDDFNFTYDGKNLMKITHYSSDKDVAEYTFTKDGKNVVEITVNSYTSKDYEIAAINPLQFVLPNEIAEVIKPSAEKATVVYRLVWDGKNLASMEEHRNGVLVANYDWKYDDFINPLKGLFSNGNGSLNGFEMLYSANNVVESHSVTHLAISDVESHNKYDYMYEDDYPVKKIWVSTSTTGLEVTHTQSFLYN